MPLPTRAIVNVNFIYIAQFIKSKLKVLYIQKQGTIEYKTNNKSAITEYKHSYRDTPALSQSHTQLTVQEYSTTQSLTYIHNTHTDITQ